MNIIFQNQDQTLNIINILQEDSDILSWITGSWSKELEKPLTKGILPKDIALLLAKELADFVQVIPGPYAFEAFLKRCWITVRKIQKHIRLLQWLIQLMMHINHRFFPVIKWMVVNKKILLYYFQ